MKTKILMNKEINKSTQINMFKYIKYYIYIY